ncbi:hypothetical protein ACFC8N_40030 [Streptomyces sp. NPDC055966]|uniref:hypothetical protein n=1 Tax=Streptomyces sp. NPDC055966 TaxID=3345669 RepID=UPI0035E36798
MARLCLAAAISLTPLAAPAAAQAAAAASVGAASPAHPAAMAGKGGLNLLVQGANWEVLQTARYANGKWAPTKQLFKSWSFYDFTDVVQKGRLRLFIEQPTGRDVTLEETTQNPDGSWPAPTPMHGLAPVPVTSKPTRNYLAAAVVGTHVHLVYIDTNGRLMHTMEQANGTWTAPDQVAPGGAYRNDWFESLSAASVGGGLQVAAVDQIHRTVLHTALGANGRWTPWSNVLSWTGTPRHWGMPIRVAMAGFGSSLQMVVLTNGQVAQYHTIRSPNGHWNTWDDINARVDFNHAGFIGTVLNEVTAVNVAGNLQLVFASGDDRGTLFHTMRYTNGAWTRATLVQHYTHMSAWRPAGVAGSSG